MNFTGQKFQFHERGKWNDFQPATSNLLLSQKSQGNAGSFTFRGTTYHVNFTTMTQTNTVTNYQRNLRIVGTQGGGQLGGRGHRHSSGSFSSSNNRANWEWVEGGHWRSYDATTQKAFNTALKSGRTSVNVVFGNTTYLVDLRKMSQTNTTTVFTRSIRPPSNYTPPPAPSNQLNQSKPGFFQKIQSFMTTRITTF